MGLDLPRNSFSVKSVEDPNFDSLVQVTDLVIAMHEVTSVSEVRLSGSRRPFMTTMRVRPGDRDA